MSNSTERDDRIATQTLWDIYLKSGQRQQGGNPGSGSRTPRNSTRGEQPKQAQRPNIVAAPSRPPGMGRIVTSGDFQNARPSSEGSDLLQRELQAKGSSRTPRSQASERVTVIVQRPVSPKDDAKQPAAEGGAVPTDLPVPSSAFAQLQGAGNSARSSVDLTPFPAAAQPARQTADEEAGTQSDEQPEALIDGRESCRPAKRLRLDRSVSINTILERVGSQEQGPLKDVAGTAPLTVQEIVASPTKTTAQGAAIGQQLKLGSPAPGKTHAQPPAPTLPNRKSSDQSTLDIHKQIALKDSSNTIETAIKEVDERPSPARASSIERDLHPSIKSEGLTAALEEGKAGEAATQTAGQAAAGSKEEQAPHKLAMWSGKVKHRLRTAEGASVKELFNVSVMIPEQLMEQMPPTLFVSTLAGRANVKLGKHFVSQCSLSELADRQRQKVTTLATMRLVAICELQHCTLTLVPFTDSQHGLRMVGFMIAED